MAKKDIVNEKQSKLLRCVIKECYLNEVTKRHLNSIPRNKRSSEISYILENKKVSEQFDLAKASLTNQSQYTYESIYSPGNRNFSKESMIAAAKILNDVCEETYNRKIILKAKRGRPRKIVDASLIKHEVNNDKDFKFMVYSLLNVDINTPEDEALNLLVEFIKKGFSGFLNDFITKVSEKQKRFLVFKDS